jgi:hypothetical protein
MENTSIAGFPSPQVYGTRTDERISSPKSQVLSVAPFLETHSQQLLRFLNVRGEFQETKRGGANVRLYI